jgi:hypothetical protein
VKDGRGEYWGWLRIWVRSETDGGGRLHGGVCGASGLASRRYAGGCGLKDWGFRILADRSQFRGTERGLLGLNASALRARYHSRTATPAPAIGVWLQWSPLHCSGEPTMEGMCVMRKEFVIAVADLCSVCIDCLQCRQGGLDMAQRSTLGERQDVFAAEGTPWLPQRLRYGDDAQHRRDPAEVSVARELRGSNQLSRRARRQAGITRRPTCDGQAAGCKSLATVCSSFSKRDAKSVFCLDCSSRS